MTTVTDTRVAPKTIRPEIIEQLIAYKTREGLSDDRLGQLIDSNGSQLNRAFNGKFVGNVAKFESKVLDFFINESERKLRVGQLFPNVFSRNMHNFLETVRRTMDAAVAWSAAGKGKTSGISLYIFHNPSALLVDVKKWSRGSRGVEHLLWKSVDTTAWRPSECSRSEFLVERFKDRPRLVIVDNAQRLTKSGWEYFLDFNDDTHSPIAFVGHHDLLKSIRNDDQLHSRIGQFREIKGGDAAGDAEKMVEIYWPEAKSKLGSLPLQVLTRPGHLRALKKQLLLAREMAGEFGTPAEAFRAAHTQLIRPFSLEEEK